MELFGTGIRVSLVMPGVIDTPMTTDTLMENWKSADAVVLQDAGAMGHVGGARCGGIRATEVDVPPGSEVAEKLAALFPGVTDAVLSVGSQMMKAAGRS